MNEDHADTCRLYATRLLGAPDGEWRCVGCDPDGLELQTGPHRAASAVSAAGAHAGVLRAVLKQLADEARAR